MGASAGGLDALATILSALSPEFPIPILVVQHLKPDHKSMLSQLLARRSTIPVHEVAGGEIPLGGNVYVAPPDHHLLIEEGRLVLSHAERVRFSRPSVDRLFESVALFYSTGVIAVILTGGG